MRQPPIAAVDASLETGESSPVRVDGVLLCRKGQDDMMRRSELSRPSGRRRLLRIVPIVIASTFVLTGCDKLTGGGSIQSLSLIPGEKATFGFTAKCKTRTVNGVPEAVFYEGQFEFDDHAFNPRVRIHGDVEPNEFFTVAGQPCKDLSAELSLTTVSGFQGTYRTQPEVTLIGQGEFAVGVADGGKPKTAIPDEICVSLAGAIDYLNCGVVQGGNIQVQ
jgi:hypothetical protein